MKYILILISFIYIGIPELLANEFGETEITTEDGVEVFQNEKYYLLKKNVIITSDKIFLKSNLVKAFFDKDLYDITKIEAENDVYFESKNNNLSASGEFLSFETISELLSVEGMNSKISIESTKMLSDKYIDINYSIGTFKLLGNNSNLYNNEISILASNIKGSYKNINNIIEIQNLNVEDDNIAQIKTDDIEMYAKKAVYSKKNNTIELFENVKVIRGKETIIGDYGLINLLNDSYSVKSDNSKKVKIFMKNE